MEALLKIDQLYVSVRDGGKEIKIINGIDIELSSGEILAIVGESGSGKTTAAMAVMRLLDPGKGYRLKGSILFEGKDIMKLRDNELQSVRGKDIAMIFQEPLEALHPYIPVGAQLEEILKIHGAPGRSNYKSMVMEAMQEVELPEPAKLYNLVPSQLSGGLKQRVVIAMAVLLKPKLIIADEPTTALDVTTQAQILTLLSNLKKKLGISMLLITHDLGIVAEYADKAAVMYCGGILEYGPVTKLFQKPSHPYTIGLMKCIPYIHKKEEELYSIPGFVPRPAEVPPKGCVFSQRCSIQKPECRNSDSELISVENGHYTKCPFWREIANEQSVDRG